MPLTFEQFQATRRHVANLHDEPSIAGQIGDDGEVRPGLVYADGLFIEEETRGTMCPVYTLTIGNASRSTDNLESLERDLYEFACAEEYL